MAAHSGGLRLMTQRDIREALARIPVPSFAFEIPTLNFITANDSFVHLMGYSLTELLNLTAESIRPSTDIPSFRNSLLGDVRQGFVRARFVRKVGSVLNVKIHYWNIQTVRDQGIPVEGRIVVVEFWDEAFEGAP